MKFNLVKTIIAIFVCAIIAYNFYYFSNSESKEFYTVGVALASVITLVSALGVDFGSERTNFNIKVLAWIFFLASIIANLILVTLSIAIPVYISIVGLLLLLFTFLVYSIAKKEF